ncbi:hypothetical protein HUU61_03740 [Rhodopseudomonas palustris]|nr:hypothetical protein [Rhodopseudomonas palustris]
MKPGVHLQSAPLADQDRLASADKVARPKRRAGDDVADFIQAHRRIAQRCHVGNDRRRLLPAPALQIVVDSVFAVVEFTGQKVLESAGPYRAHEQVLADGRDDIVDLKAGFVAGEYQMVFQNLFEPVGPWFARR